MPKTVTLRKTCSIACCWTSPPGVPNGMKSWPSLKRHGRGRRQARALAGRHHAGVGGIEPALRAARRHDAAHAGHDRRVDVGIARRRREAVALGVDDRHVAGVERVVRGAAGQRQQLAPRGERASPAGGISGQARSRTSARRASAYALDSSRSAGTFTKFGSP